MALYSVFQDVLFEADNLRRSADYSRTHNPYHRNLSVEDVEQRLMACVNKLVEQANDGAHVFATIEPAIDVWFVLDHLDEGTLHNGTIPPGTDPKYRVNFFVRLGRQPNASLVEDQS